MKNIKTLILSAAIITLASVAAFAKPDRLSTQQWKLVQVNNQRVTTSNAFLEININQTRFMGNTGCNRMFGAVSVNGRRVDFSNVGTTKMFCGQPQFNRIETAFVKALENANRYRQVGDTLELLDRNRVTLKFRAIHKTDDEKIGLEDKKWMLDAIKGIPVSKSGKTAFVVFDQKRGSAGGNSNCNVFGGSYTASGSTIKITEIISTMRACEEGDRMTIEREFLDGLQKANRYNIENGKLLLYRDKRLLLTLNGEAK